MLTPAPLPDKAKKRIDLGKKNEGGGNQQVNLWLFFSLQGDLVIQLNSWVKIQ